VDPVATLTDNARLADLVRRRAPEVAIWEADPANRECV
jgi:hypothetical protein